ncbi:MAG: glutathione S-transferase family protein [Reyranella sp.]|uniref:glutathione S-transferase family protein n=1 Tax=Reyranella sp. TaxID=1929291 RepID=UPI0012204908|nr:glutathione S-transferase family protein [Reyranella sp.]TAJ85361.1 MAG: glutathione S-transferase family protein [Reyranella sp.]
MLPQIVESANSLILHQYDFSNFAEKARLMMGFKGLTWRAVEIPPIAPKPKLTPLTGGYRRTPVLQDGADVWCDTKLIARELERRVPQPTFYPPSTSGAADAIAWWAEQQFMRPTALYVSGINADHMPEGLHADRAKLHGLPMPSIEAVRKAAFRNLQLVRPQVRWIADMLADGRRYLLGDVPCIADFATYHVVWFFRGRHIDCREVLNPYPRLLAWRDRMAEVGHGNRIDIDADEALAEACAATPATPRPSQPQEGDPRPGQRARVRASDNAKDWIEGEVHFIDADEIALLHENDEVGQVAVHFPRLGYDWRPMS